MYRSNCISISFNGSLPCSLLTCFRAQRRARCSDAARRAARRRCALGDSNSTDRPTFLRRNWCRTRIAVELGAPEKVQQKSKEKFKANTINYEETWRNYVLSHKMSQSCLLPILLSRAPQLLPQPLPFQLHLLLPGNCQKRIAKYWIPRLKS